jgi:hypothetical protein
MHKDHITGSNSNSCIPAAKEISKEGMTVLKKSPTRHQYSGNPAKIASSLCTGRPSTSTTE